MQFGKPGYLLLEILAKIALEKLFSVFSRFGINSDKISALSPWERCDSPKYSYYWVDCV